jgi:signal transduction histidine kinase
VTGALAMEEQLREAQKMEAVGRLAGGVAHDFNNSLTAIGGFASLIASGSKEPETREAAETILGAAKAGRRPDSRAAGLLAEVAPAAAGHRGQRPGGAIRPMLLRLLGEDVSVVIESRVSAAMVRVDPGGLERVILNLAANARDAMPGGGPPDDLHRPRMVDEARGAGRVRARWVAISVADTGAGIPAELHSQVFDPFFTTKPVGSGNGARPGHGQGFRGPVGRRGAFNSEAGHGTTIEILLPEVADTRKPPAAVPPQPGLARGDETILVVEDEPPWPGQLPGSEPERLSRPARRQRRERDRSAARPHRLPSPCCWST